MKGIGYAYIEEDLEKERKTMEERIVWRMDDTTKAIIDSQKENYDEIKDLEIFGLYDQLIDKKPCGDEVYDGVARVILDTIEVEYGSSNIYYLYAQGGISDVKLKKIYYGLFKRLLRERLIKAQRFVEALKINGWMPWDDFYLPFADSDLENYVIDQEELYLSNVKNGALKSKWWTEEDKRRKKIGLEPCEQF